MRAGTDPCAMRLSSIAVASSSVGGASGPLSAPRNGWVATSSIAGGTKSRL